MLLIKLKYATLLCLVFSDPALADVFMFGSGPNQFSMEFVPIGNPGNSADASGSPNPAGAVAYDYQIGKYEVRESMITKYNANFGTANGLAITENLRGVNKPATGLSWNEAARFINWLNTSTGGFAAYKFTTSGVNDNIALWAPADTLDFDPANPFRSLRSNYVLPSTNEWYKAAYYDPNTNIYFDYPTGNNTAPTPVASGTSTGTAVYNQTIDQGPADVDNAGGLSPFGIMGLGGNVYELEETESDLVNDIVSSDRGVRGGAWLFNSSPISSSTRFSILPEDGYGDIGFRVVVLSSMVPESSTLLLVSLSTCVVSLVRRHRLMSY